MKLSKIDFSNFRCFVSETINISDYTSLVGPNNCGKSTVLRALNIFFGEGTKAGAVQLSDFAVGSASTDLSIIIEFDAVTGQAAEDLSHYVRDERVLFEIIASRDENGLVESKCRGLRYGLPELAPFFAAQKASERRPIYDQFIADGKDLPKWQNMDSATQAVRDFEQARSDEFVRIPSSDSAYGATGPIPILRKYLDWIYVPAVKDVSGEASEQRNSAFSKLVLFAIRSQVNFDDRLAQIQNEAATKLTEMLKDTESIVATVEGQIDKAFRDLSTTPVNVGLIWDETQSIALRAPSIRSIFKDGMLRDSPENFGHGIQRTYIMALLSVAAKVQNEVENFKLIIGIEEPELYQHPPQAKFLASALADLAEGNAQVLVTTHSPYFVSGRTFESIRSLKKTANTTKIYSWSIDEQRAYCSARKGGTEIGSAAALSGMDKSLRSNIAEMFFASKLVLVEGIEDEAIITAYLKYKKIYPQFLISGGHIVPVGGKSKISVVIALARGMSIDVFSVFDFDMNLKPEDRQNDDLIIYAADTKAKVDVELSNDFLSDYFFASKNNIQIGIEECAPNWPTVLQEIASEWGWNLARLRKDPMLLEEGISRYTLSHGDIPSLEKLTSGLQKFWST